MTEKYGDCHLCNGTGELRDPVMLSRVIPCVRCGETGFEGGADALRQKEADQDWEREMSAVLADF